MKHFDVIVIGSGGGSKITRPAANLGLKVAIIDKGKLGGTCLNHGCIPSKMLIHSADLMSDALDLDRFNLKQKVPPKPQFSELVKRVSRVIDKESRSIGPLYDKHPNITYFKKAAKFIAPKAIQVGRDVITADKIFIAVGAEPMIPDIEGLDNVPYDTYFEALRCEKQPKSLIVIGGGYIATELGHFFGALGTRLEFVVRSQFLKNEDGEISEIFNETFSKSYAVHREVNPEKVEKKSGLIHLTLKLPSGQKKVIKAERLLIATGVRAATKTLSLEKANIITDKKGFIKVDKQLQTNVRGVYAFGDCIGTYLFRHSANFQGEYLFNRVIKKSHRGPIVYPPMPHAVFTHPQIGGVGPTEEDLKAKRKNYIVGRCEYKNSAMGMALQSSIGLLKLIFDQKTQKLLSAHAIGYEASTLVHMPIAYINMGARLKDLLNTIYVHPALSEIVRNAARDARGQFEKLGKKIK
jgi:mycothione reductase